MILVALGKKGSGKSAVLRKLATHRLRAAPQALILYHDPACQLDDRAGWLCTSIAHARERISRARVLPQLSIFRGVEVEDLARFALEVRDCTLIIDELDRACTGKVWKSESVRRIVHEGRHERIDLWGTFRSTRNVSEDVLNAADAVFLFRHSAAAYYDLQAIEHRLGPSYATACQGLEFGQFVIWRDD